MRGPATTAPDVFVNIKVEITDARITMAPRGANRGDEGRFILHNTGKLPHTFKLGNKSGSAGTQTGFSSTLKPGEQKVFLLFLDYRARLPYRSASAHDVTKPAMRGFFTIR